MDFYDLLLAKRLSGGGGSAVLIDKNITENGTYNASSDNADGYKKVVVDVSGGDTDLADLDVYTADYLNSPPTLTDGALNNFTRQIVA